VNYYGTQSRLAAENFPLSGLRFGRRFIRALGLLKAAAAETNAELELLEAPTAGAIKKAAQEVAEGKHDDQFIVDVFQTGSGTSTNMNANEVIAARANEILGASAAGGVHPNDQVNLCQSSNDAIPTATHVAALMAISEVLLPGLQHLSVALSEKAEQFDPILKTGRTHLMDATPVRLGQEFGGFQSQIEHGLARIAGVLPHLSELALGGTAVGTGINAHPEFAEKTIARISAATGIPLTEAANHFEAQGARDAVVEASGALKTVAVSIAKIANDLRWMASGPAGGIGEITLPALQAGSSIMPGKVNPVIPEAVIQVAAQVIGNDATITLGGLGGVFELNTMIPVMAYNLLFSIETLGAAAELLASRCVEGIAADGCRCAEPLKSALMIATALVPELGYEKVAKIAETAELTGKSIRDIVLEGGMMTQDQVDKALDLRRMTEGGLP